MEWMATAGEPGSGGLISLLKQETDGVVNQVVTRQYDAVGPTSMLIQLGCSSRKARVTAANSGELKML
jgi:hypothetical protein